MGKDSREEEDREGILGPALEVSADTVVGWVIRGFGNCTIHPELKSCPQVEYDPGHPSRRTPLDPPFSRGEV